MIRGIGKYEAIVQRHFLLHRSNIASDDTQGTRLIHGSFRSSNQLGRIECCNGSV